MHYNMDNFIAEKSFSSVSGEEPKKYARKNVAGRI